MGNLHTFHTRTNHLQCVVLAYYFVINAKFCTELNSRCEGQLIQVVSSLHFGIVF